MLPETRAEPLPPRSVLLHIGPHKTGTTALQGAFHTNRQLLEEHGVHYAGRGRQPMLAALAMTGRPGRRGDKQATQRHWRVLTEDVAAAADKRVVVSSEFLADASVDVAQQVVDGLGRERVHVVVTLRPLGKILPSQWQQYVQNGLRTRYDSWLRSMLEKPPYEKPTPTFWMRHAHDRLLERWTAAVGAPNATVIVLDESDRTMLMRTFGQLLDLPDGLLVPETGVPNRSLSLSEVEVIRLLNEEYKRSMWPDAIYARFLRDGVAKSLIAQRRPADAEPVITTPLWALKRAAEIGAAAADAIAASGARVIGDLTTLGKMSDDGRPDDEPVPADPRLPASAAAIALVATINASRGMTWPDPAGEPGVTASPARRASGGKKRRRLRAVARRLRRRLRAAARRLRRRRPPRR